MAYQRFLYLVLRLLENTVHTLVVRGKKQQMLINKYSLNYSPKDLQKEWGNKIKQLKTVLLDFPKFSDIINNLIKLSEYIYESEHSYELFPGIKLDKLVINSVSGGKINTKTSLIVQPLNNEKEIFIISLEKQQEEKLIVEWKEEYNGNELVQAFESKIGQLTL